MFYDFKDYNLASQWILRGHIDKNDSLASLINDKLAVTKKTVKITDTVQVVSVKGNSILSNMNNYSFESLNKAKESWENTGKSNYNKWYASVKKTINAVKTRVEKEYKERKQKEEEAEKLRFRNILIIAVVFTITFIISLNALDGGFGYKLLGSFFNGVFWTGIAYWSLRK